MVHPIFTVPPSIKQHMRFLLEIFGLVRNRAAAGQVFQGSNGRNDAVEPLFGPVEAPVPRDVIGNVVQVSESLR
jgi:hypothetical protein